MGCVVGTNEYLDIFIAVAEVIHRYPPFVFKGNEKEIVTVRVRVRPDFDACLFYRCEHFWKKDWRAVSIQRGFVDRLKKETEFLEVAEVY